MLRGIPCVLMRGGSPKGLFFLASDLPSDVAARDRGGLPLISSASIVTTARSLFTGRVLVRDQTFAAATGRRRPDQNRFA